MRVLLHITMDTEKTNEVVKQGKLGQIMGQIMDDLKPEAAYFTVDGGRRSGYLILNIEDPNEMMRLGEPFFLALHAEVDLKVIMTPEEIMNGDRYLESAAKKYT